MIMKWMGGWSLEDLDQIPTEYRDEIVAMIVEEQEEIERARN